MIQNYINLGIDLEFSSYNGSMSVEIFDDVQQLIFLDNVTERYINLAFMIKLPNRIKFKLDNKNPNRDTKLDTEGKVLADKYVRLAGMRLGGIPIKPVTLFKICKYTADHETKFDTYWGFNGSAEIYFDADNFIKWHLKTNNLLTL